VISWHVKLKQLKSINDVFAMVSGPKTLAASSKQQRRKNLLAEHPQRKTAKPELSRSTVKFVDAKPRAAASSQ
jgi:hypothetical protein